MCVADWRPNCDAYSYSYGNSDGYSYSDAYSYQDGYPDSDSYLDAVMPLGDTFNSLGQPGPSNAPAPAEPPPVGGAMSNDHVKEAVKTNPVQAAHIKVEMSKQALKSLALRMKQAQHVV